MADPGLIMNDTIQSTMPRNDSFKPAHASSTQGLAIMHQTETHRKVPPRLFLRGTSRLLEHHPAQGRSLEPGATSRRGLGERDKILSSASYGTSLAQGILPKWTRRGGREQHLETGEGFLNRLPRLMLGGGVPGQCKQRPSVDVVATSLPGVSLVAGPVAPVGSEPDGSDDRSLQRFILEAGVDAAPGHLYTRGQRGDSAVGPDHGWQE